MVTGLSLILIAAGAILAFAVNVDVSQVNVNAVGVILLIVGIMGLVYSLLFLTSFAPFGPHDDGRYM